MPKHKNTRHARDFAYLIFDMDGTIAESLAVWQTIDEQFLAKRGLLCDEEYLQAVRIRRLYESALYTIERYGLDENPDDIVQEWIDMAYVQYRDVIELRPGVVPFLAEQARLGKKLAICTSSDRIFVEALLSRYGVLPLFESIVCAREHELGKEFPDIWHFTARSLGAKASDCLVFEDTLAVLLSAKAAGCTTVAIEDGHAGHEKAALIEAADYYCKDFAELEHLFTKVE